VALGKGLVLVGLLIAAGGALLWWGVPLGRLPGDFVVKRGAFTFYVPLTTSVLISLAATLVMALLKK
jgi:hypothetical protein